MQKTYWTDILGLQMNQAIKKFRYPDFGSDLISIKDCDQLRSVLTQLPKDNHALRKLIINLIRKGKIEEITELKKDIIFHVHIKHENEYYMIDLKLDGIQWSFHNIQYIEKAKNPVLVWSIRTIIGLCILLVSLTAYHYFYGLPGALPVFSSSNSAEQLNPPGQQGDTTEEILDLEQLRRQAEAQNLIIMTAEQLQQQISDAVDEALRTSELENNDTVPPEGEDTSETETENEAADEHENEQNENTPDEFRITIQPGMTGHAVANRLVEQGVISNANQFLNTLEEENVGSRIQIGTFTIPANSTHLEIIAILTGR